MILPHEFNNCMLNDKKVIKYENVKSYHYDKFNLVLNINQNNINSEKEIYYIIDTHTDAFGHYFYESFIYYKNIIELNKLYSNVKIVTTNHKKYIKTLFKFFNIHNEIIYELKPNNICFFPMVFSLNNHKINQSYFKELINEISNDINDKLPYVSENNIMLLPRNKKDNYAPNNRSIELIDLIEQHIIDIGGIVLDTYTLNNIFYQFTILKNSNIIILDFGSSFLVNCIFLKHKKIIVIDNFNLMNQQSSTFISIKIICDIIKNNNNVIVTTSKHLLDNIQTFIK